VVDEIWLKLFFDIFKHHGGVQSINNVYAIVNKVENVLVNTYIFDLIDNDVYVVYVLYSSMSENCADEWKLRESLCKKFIKNDKIFIEILENCTMGRFLKNGSIDFFQNTQFLI
jgi:hypothetical protein